MNKKEVGFEPTMGKPTDLQSATINRSVTPSYLVFIWYFLLVSDFFCAEL